MMTSGMHRRPFEGRHLVLQDYFVLAFLLSPTDLHIRLPAPPPVLKPGFCGYMSSGYYEDNCHEVLTIKVCPTDEGSIFTFLVTGLMKMTTKFKNLFLEESRQY